MASRDMSVNLPVLTDKNWGRWSTQMRILFCVQDVNSVMEGAVSASDLRGIEKEEFKRKDDRALLIIHQCVEDKHFEKIQNAASAREAWNILVGYHAGGEKVKKVKLQSLRRQYEHLLMEDGDKVSEFFSKILSIVNQMKSCGDTVTDLMVIEKIMRSLPSTFDHIVVAIKESRDLGKLKIEELQSSLEAYEMRMRERNPIKREEQVLKAQHVEKKTFKKWKGKNGKGKWRKDRNKDDQNESSTEDEGKSEKNFQKKDKRDIECFNCHRYGHYATECYAEKKE
ncbi:uncharacterized protein LOC108334426 isoform X1 [Vigna angularis]|uniref:uncharacterized protein LOC108334426 isoform X1 n=1 Tax=Phaseolus angularis TaxID=3914 RepID=UPI00080A65C3|nr:uncharacterized protein LOC108334426 isoform X1 [Vigna angularis]XP_052726793.1 uncharacterized protein LOC108334426 isoform X1 [Vigna angularis]